MKLKILTDLFFSLPMVRSTPRQIPASVFVATRLPPSEPRDVAMVSAVRSSHSSMQVASRPSRLSRHFAPIVLAVMATALSACSGGDGPSLINDGGEQILPAGQTMAPLVLANSNDDYQISFCRSEPALPAGMSVAVDSENNACTISGTPTAAEVASTYRIIAVAISVAEGSSSSDEIDVSISVTLANGTELSGQATLSAQRGTAASAGSGWSFAGTFFGGSGDESDSDEGESESTDSDSDEDETTESESEDGDQSALTGPAPDLRFTDTPVEFVAGVSASFDFTNNGGAPTSCLYAGNSDLPPAGLVLGLSADGTTCRISGIATTSAELTAYYILATNDLGISAALIHLAVSAPPSALLIVDPTAERSLAAVVIDLMLGASVNFALPDERFSSQPFASDYIRTLTCTASPSLPAGLSIVNASSLLGCEIVGVPQTLAGWTSYLITAEGIYPLNGASFQATVEVDLRVRAAGTTPGQAATRTPQLVQPAAPIEVTLGSQEQIVMGNTGGAPTQCDSQTSLPTGLAIDISVDGFTCAIVGTVSDADVAYYANNPLTVIATNAIGSSQVTVNITVVVPPPARVPPVLGFLGGLCVLAVGEYYEIELPGGDQLFFPNGGGNPSGYANTVQSCATTPLLPAGLQVVPNSAKDTCVILGTPEVAIATTAFTVTATNAAGTGEGGVEIIVYPSVSTAVNVAAPALQATADLLDVALGSEVYAIYTNVGGLPDSCTVSPALPSGLEVILSPDLTTCIIIGSPTNVNDAHYTPNIYTVNAVNAGGSSETDITISILPPPRISDLPGLCELTVGEHYEIEMPNRTYPFFDNNFVRNYFNDRPAGAVQSCASAPALPAGLQVTPHPTRDTCLISGTPEVASIESTYAITATNASGSVVGGLVIVVYPSATVAAPVLQAAPDLINVALVRDVNAVFANTGGLPQTCTVRPALPNGLTVSLSDNDATCVITGAPRDVSDADYARNTYTVVAENAGGRSRANIIISILPPPIIYGLSGLCELTVGEYYEIMMPDRDYYGSFIFNNDNQRPAGAVQSCASAPALPAGLQVTPHPTRDTCLISGTPEAPSAEATFTITATNASGADDGHVDIVVYPSVTVAAPVLHDAAELVDVALGSEVYAVFTNTGGLPETCTVSPALPNGLAVVLSEDEATCIITGAPRDIGGFQYYRNIYTVYTLNAGGHSYANIIISILPQPALFDLDGLCELTVGEHYEILMPSQYLYGSFLARYFYDSPVGAVQSCASSPPLPAGLRVTPHPTLDTCVISGTPEEPSAEATYTITATNASGADDGHVDIVVYPSVSAPALQVATDLIDVALGSDVYAVFTNTGGLPQTCTVSPTLPTGLAVELSDNEATCIITGSPTDVDDAHYAQSTYTVTATNEGGRSRADISISILPLPRLFNLVGLCELTVGEYYEIVIPGYQGGTVNLVGGGRYYVSEPSGYPQSCASAPSLPAGLRVAPHSTLDTCVISGTPEEPSAEAAYTITAANASGADDGSVDIVVYPLVAAPALADLPDQIIAVGQEIDLTFANTGDAPAAETGCAVRPTLPAGMAVAVADDGSTCTITGVSTAASASVIYTVTATNTAGSSDASVSIRIDADTASTAVRIAQVSAGLEHTCAISEGGQLYCWGINYDHQLGLGIDEANYMRPVLVGTDSDWATVSAGYNGTCAVKTDGSLYCWGILRRELNLSSQLGSEPTRIGDSYDWVDVEINTRVCALKSSGQLFCWGLGEYGVLGNGDSASRSEPTLVGNTPESGWSGMNFGTDSACAIDADEQLYCWGKSVYRLLTNEIERGIRYVPTAIGDLSWSAVATEDSAICAISTEGRLYCWGYSERGGLGNGVDGRSTLTEPTQVGQAENWRQISTGHQNACAVNEQNQLYCWGFGRFGALGLGDEANRTTPTRVGVRNDWAQVSFGSDHVCAVNLSAELYCWGIGYAGALGVGDTDGRLEPALVLIDSTEPVVDGSGPDNNGDGNNPDTTPTGDPDDDANNPDTTPTGDPDDVADETTEPAPAQFVQISTGSNYTCAVDGDGDLNCWGPGVAIGFSSLFGGYYPAPTTVALGEGMNWASVSAGGALVCAITTEGALYCWEVHPCPLLSWGFSDASLGSGPFRGAYMVAQSNWSQVSAGKLHACAINSDDELHCWGDGSGGRLGTVDNTPGRVGANYTWADVSAGVGHTCASNTQGELYCWGRGDDGQLGLNDNTNYSTPRRVGADTDWADISVGSYHSCAVKSSGQLFCWGSDDSDQLGLGQGNLNNAAYPTRVGSGENWATVSSGARHTCALTDASEYYCWGTGPVNRYFFATSTTIDWHRPVLMSNRADWTQITGGNSMLCALNTRGYAYCSRPFFYSITSTAPINEVDNFDFFPDPARRTN